MKILVISLAGIGDTVFATPLIHELRAHFPEADIDALVRWTGSKDLLEENPHLSSVHQKDFLAAGKGESLRMLWQLRRREYDYSFNTHPQSRMIYRAVARVINARVRVSHQYDNASGWDRLLVNRTFAQDYGKHAVENNLAFLEAVGGRPLMPRHEYEIFLSPAELGWAEEFIARHNWGGPQAAGHSCWLGRHEESRSPTLAARQLPGALQ